MPLQGLNDSTGDISPVKVLSCAVLLGIFLVIWKKKKYVIHLIGFIYEKLFISWTKDMVALITV